MMLHSSKYQSSYCRDNDAETKTLSDRSIAVVMNPVKRILNDLSGLDVDSQLIRRVQLF